MADLFRRAKGGARGYDPHEVNEFFARAQAIYEGVSPEQLGPDEVRTVAFAQVRGGYDEAQVDGALDRLDSAFTRKQRAEFIALHGQQAWLDKIVDRATTLYDRLGRPDGQKFAAAESGKPAYDKVQVDSLLHRLAAYFNDGTPLASADVRHAVFTPVRGKRGYAMGPVDAFLDRALEVLLAAE
ncbi:MAG: DivIVA domain-containing protein [Bifidobacteriaceae bacterium]|jgi:DivIVA domain-containing protein|nr:DivIVA domain-containing protein [Bifidobacteriaceae bacterium]